MSSSSCSIREIIVDLRKEKQGHTALKAFDEGVDYGIDCAIIQLTKLHKNIDEKIHEIKNALTIIILSADMGVNTDKVIQEQAERIDNLLAKNNHENEHKFYARKINRIKKMWWEVMGKFIQGKRRK